MAKKTNKLSRCPFTGKGCKNCPLYRSRHYSLCFNQHYVENIDDKEATIKSVEGSILKHGFVSLGHHAYK
ncbi:MAG: hypothetical protein JW864_14160 [Spirochaetes bacterium]|nr:hypothetical protein [Spirochaetota bacterium]